jgi:hypothetical protein
MTVRRSAKEVAEMLHRVYDDKVRVTVAAERLVELRDGLGFLASVYAERDMDSIPGSEKMFDHPAESPENRKWLEDEEFASDLCGEIDAILKQKYPEA